MELEKIKQVAEERLKNSRSHVWKELGNKYYHGERVARLALELRRRVIPGDNSHDDILTAAAWLHDIANGLSSDHAAEGARLVRGLIPDFCTPQELDAMAQRLSVAVMLNEGAVYNKIVTETGASTATISRVNKTLTYQTAGGYEIVLDRIKNNV